ncbi:MAG: hypothetical protein KY431_00005, partial [Actinobacteria bacterium]|nr:hypothetical protein [Actinomycetota bacterium]
RRRHSMFFVGSPPPHVVSYVAHPTKNGKLRPKTSDLSAQLAEGSAHRGAGLHLGELELVIDLPVFAGGALSVGEDLLRTGTQATALVSTRGGWFERGYRRPAMFATRLPA